MFTRGCYGLKVTDTQAPPHVIHVDDVAVVDDVVACDIEL